MSWRYPTEPELKFIREYDFTKESLKPFLDFLQDIWAMSNWGFEIKDHKDELFPKVKLKRLCLSTGGWSGNEDIINALEDNRWFYCFYWYSSRRGGHYIFEFDEKRLMLNIDLKK